MLMVAAGVGLLAGLHASIWGAFKDAPHEGFSWRQFLRSPLVAALTAPGLAMAANLDPTTPVGLFLLFGLTYAVERALAETWKTFFRDQDQSKYAIPMQLAVLGRPVVSRGWRALAGLCYAAVILGGVAGIAALQARVGPWPPLAVALGVGALGGWFSAVGGAWKDAPVEGFQLFKFFRSPLVAAAVARLLLEMTTSWPLVMLGAIGFTVALTETYKTFVFPASPRGKFSGRPVRFPPVLSWRRWLVPVHAVIWLVVTVAGWVGVQAPL